MEQEIQELLKQIDRYIEESKDENFDRYLQQMKMVLQKEPERLEEVRAGVDRNIERYRENMKKLERPQNVQPQVNSEKKEKNGMEYKIGTGVLSGIGILFVLIAVVILLKNFVPKSLLGMLMIAFFAILWLVSQLVVDRKFKKLSLGLSSAGIIGLYLSAAVNYYHFETLPMQYAQGILVLVAIVSWLVGFYLKSTILQCMSFIGYMVFGLILPWGKSLPEFIVSVAIFLVLNLMWNLGARGEKRNLIQILHGIFYVVYAAIYSGVLLANQPEDGIVCVLIYGIVALVVLNFFYQKQKGMEYLPIWISGSVIQAAYILGITTYMNIVDEVGMIVLLALPVTSLVMLLIRKFSPKSQALYYQGAIILFYVNIWGLDWPMLIGLIVLCLVDYFAIRKNVLSNQIVTSILFWLLIARHVPNEAVIPAAIGFLLIFTTISLYVPKLRAPKPAALVYTNISLIGFTVLVSGIAGGNYISNTITLVLMIATVLLLWRKKCFLPERVQGLVLTLVLAYMVIVYRIQLPVVVSILLMVVAMIAIIGGFIKKEKAMRIYGLVLALFVCGKVVLYDFWDLELLAKSILLLVVGLIAIGISLIYVVLEHSQKKQNKNL